MLDLWLRVTAARQIPLRRQMLAVTVKGMAMITSPTATDHNWNQLHQSAGGCGRGVGDLCGRSEVQLHQSTGQ